MGYLDQVIGRRLIERGLANHAQESGRHLEALVTEEASGEVGNGNQSFFLTYLPVAGPQSLVKVWTRGLLRREGVHYELSDRGRNLWLYDPPRSDGDESDGAPVVEYRTAFDVGVTVTDVPALLAAAIDETMPAWRPPAAMEDDGATAARAIGLI